MAYEIVQGTYIYHAKYTCTNTRMQYTCPDDNVIGLYIRHDNQLFNRSIIRIILINTSESVVM